MSYALASAFVVYTIFAAFSFIFSCVGVLECIFDDKTYLVERFGKYRGGTLLFLATAVICACWLPFLIFLWVRGLVKGL